MFFSASVSEACSYRPDRADGSPSRVARGGLRAEWESMKLDVMEACVRDKFTRNADLRRRLLETGDAELVEGNTWGDRFWGVCDGEGENHLGRVLIKVRGELRK